MSNTIHGTLNGVYHAIDEASVKDTKGHFKDYIIAEGSDGGMLCQVVEALMKIKYLPLGPPNCTYLPAVLGGRSMEEIKWFQAMMYNGEEQKE